ncbi:MAG: GerAB/ArcD/ProY family transporter [Desulfurispora sp.]|uniref:GerAB/ArcD/ProY family transporter n=1 Tax=Desulfurispora sp. TaxID=3014275 RepID=UPI004049B0EB
MQDEIISSRQFALLVCSFIIGTAILLVPGQIIATSRQDAWLALVLSFFPGLLLTGLLVLLQKYYPGKSLVQMLTAAWGRAGLLPALVLVWFALHLGALVLRNIGDFIQTVLLFQTPLAATHILVALLAAYALFLGLEPLTRALALLMPLNLALYLLLQVIDLPISRWAELQPLLDRGWEPVLISALNLSSFPVGEMILLALIVWPIRESPRRLYASWVQGLGGGIFILLLATIGAITVLGPDDAGRVVFARLSTADAGPVSHLTVPVLSFNWFIFTFAKFALCYYAFVSSLATLTGISDYRSLVLPAGALLTTFSLSAYQNLGQELDFARVIWPVYALPIEYGLPILLLVSHLVRSKIAPGRRRTSRGR